MATAYSTNIVVKRPISNPQLLDLCRQYEARLSGVRPPLKAVFLNEAKRIAARLESIVKALSDKPKGILNRLLNNRKTRLLRATYRALSQQLLSWIDSTIKGYAK